MGRPKKAEPTEQIRVPKSLARRVRRLASHMGLDPGDYIASRLGSLLDKDEEKMLRDIERERQGDKSS